LTDERRKKPQQMTTSAPRQTPSTDLPSTGEQADETKVAHI